MQLWPTQNSFAVQKYYSSFPDKTNHEACFLNIEDALETVQRLSSWGDPEDVDYIVVTDGEEILGIGDQGAQGVGISQAKLFFHRRPSYLLTASVLMTLCAGINPNRTLPVILDVGTNVPSFLLHFYSSTSYCRMRNY